jgi:hypothetical protein
MSRASLAFAIMTAATVLTAAPLRAQTYDPHYPFCLEGYAVEGGNIDCRFTLLSQCNQSTAGGGGQCITNPYFAGAQAPAGARHARDRRGH